jgi:serine/threonine protein kinase
MDYCGIGSVLDLISNNEDKMFKLKNISEEQIACIMANVVRGLVYLHAKEIIHSEYSVISNIIS